jgi:hypothetical protein
MILGKDEVKETVERVQPDVLVSQIADRAHDAR